MTVVDRNKFIEKWNEKKAKKEERVLRLKHEAKILKEFKSEFKKIQRAGEPVSLSYLDEQMEDVGKLAIMQYLDKWVRENVCKRLEVEGDTWYYFDVDVPE